VRLPYVVEFVKVDVTSALLVKEAENDFVLGVRLREQVLENTPVVDVDFPLLLAVSDLKEDTVLVPLNFVLVADAVSFALFSTLTNCRRNCLRSLRSQAQQPR
jgi:hypothetical protein